MSGAPCIIHTTQTTTCRTIETHTSHKCRNIVRDELVLYNVRSVWVIRGQCVATRGAQQRLVLYKSPTPKHLLIIEISQNGISKKSNENKKLKSHYIQDFL